MCSYIFGVVLFRIPGQTRNPEFRPEFPVTNFPEQNRTGIPKNSIFRRQISGSLDIRLNPNNYTYEINGVCSIYLRLIIW